MYSDKLAKTFESSEFEAVQDNLLPGNIFGMGGAAPAGQLAVKLRESDDKFDQSRASLNAIEVSIDENLDQIFAVAGNRDEKAARTKTVKVPREKPFEMNVPDEPDEKYDKLKNDIDTLC